MAATPGRRLVPLGVDDAAVVAAVALVPPLPPPVVADDGAVVLPPFMGDVLDDGDVGEEDGADADAADAAADAAALLALPALALLPGLSAAAAASPSPAFFPALASLVVDAAADGARAEAAAAAAPSRSRSRSRSSSRDILLAFALFSSPPPRGDVSWGEAESEGFDEKDCSKGLGSRAWRDERACGRAGGRRPGGASERERVSERAGE